MNNLEFKLTMQESEGSGLALDNLKHKLDNLGYVKSHSGLMNDNKLLNIMKNSAVLSENGGNKDK